VGISLFLGVVYIRNKQESWCSIFGVLFLGVCMGPGVIRSLEFGVWNLEFGILQFSPGLSVLNKVHGVHNKTND